MRVFALVLALISVSSPAQVIDKNIENSSNGSLWKDGNNPLLDRTAREEGDLVTILISEQTVASYSASTSATKSDSNSVGTNVLNSVFGLLNPGPTATATSNVGGNGSTAQNGNLRARLTAVVISKTARGHLIIEGKREIVVNKQSQTFLINGIVRTDDIAPDNTVLSENLAQASIRLDGKGMIADRQRKGVLTQILDWLF